MVAVQVKLPIMQPVFSRHETFPPRNGWLKKGFDAIKEDSEFFSREDVAVCLGVGKNMAKAIRYWCTAFKISQEDTEKSKNRMMIPTDFGNCLLADDGWDPYLEDTASLWLLHWKLLQQPCTATCWHFAFNLYRHAEFAHEDFLNDLSEYSRQNWAGSSFSEATLKNDVSCFARMYCKDEGSKHVSEETIGSPFSELDLVTRINDGKHLAFHIGPKTNLPNAIVAAAALEFAESTCISEKSINISQIAYGVGSPGLVFKLPESAVYAALEEIVEKRKDLSLSQTAGMVQLQFLKQPGSIAQDILAQYYSTSRR